MSDFIIKMIRVKDHSVSEAYANHCLPSWTNAGFDVKLYDAVTPDTLRDQDPLVFNTSRKQTDTERACFYSQYNLWKECYEEGVPYLILEHDAYLVNPRPIKYNPDLMVQFFGQHAMEAVMFHPEFAELMLEKVYKNGVTTGPMGLVDTYLGFFKNIVTKQSSMCLPHSRFQGPMAPVRSVLDPTVGNTVNHDTRHTEDKLKQAVKGENSLFKLVNLDLPAP